MLTGFPSNPYFDAMIIFNDHIVIVTGHCSYSNTFMTQIYHSKSTRLSLSQQDGKMDVFISFHLFPLCKHAQYIDMLFIILCGDVLR